MTHVVMQAIYWWLAKGCQTNTVFYKSSCPFCQSFDPVFDKIASKKSNMKWFEKTSLANDAMYNQPSQRLCAFSVMDHLTN